MNRCRSHGGPLPRLPRPGCNGMRSHGASPFVIEENTPAGKYEEGWAGARGRPAPSPHARRRHDGGAQGWLRAHACAASSAPEHHLRSLELAPAAAAGSPAREVSPHGTCRIRTCARARHSVPPQTQHSRQAQQVRSTTMAQDNVAELAFVELMDATEVGRRPAGAHTCALSPLSAVAFHHRARARTTHAPRAGVHAGSAEGQRRRAAGARLGAQGAAHPGSLARCMLAITPAVRSPPCVAARATSTLLRRATAAPRRRALRCCGPASTPQSWRRTPPCGYMQAAPPRARSTMRPAATTTTTTMARGSSSGCRARCGSSAAAQPPKRHRTRALPCSLRTPSGGLACWCRLRCAWPRRTSRKVRRALGGPAGQRLSPGGPLESWLIACAACRVLPLCSAALELVVRAAQAQARLRAALRQAQHPPGAAKP